MQAEGRSCIYVVTICKIMLDSRPQFSTLGGIRGGFSFIRSVLVCLTKLEEASTFSK